MNIFNQPQAVEDRYEELGEIALSDPDVVSDANASWSFQRKRLPLVIQ